MDCRYSYVRAMRTYDDYSSQEAILLKACTDFYFFYIVLYRDTKVFSLCAHISKPDTDVKFPRG